MSTSDETVSARVVVVMGVSAAGKTSVAAALAERLGVDWRDADDLHPPENVAKMANGHPLTDQDRIPWLDTVGAELVAAGPRGRVMACSALRRKYRDQLRAHAPGLAFVHLTGEPALLEQRATARTGHYMPASLLTSQLATLEPLDEDEFGVTIDVAASVESIAETASRWLTDRAL